jgi:hypothetical protein
MIRAFLYFLLSLPLITLSGFLIHAFTRLNYSSGESSLLIALSAGFIGGVLFFVFINRFTKFYVFGHELAHWIFAKVFMRETQNFKVGKDAGGVQIKDPNIWITLAPYFYPTFTIIWIPFWFVFKYFEREFSWSTDLFFGILSFTWAYHFVLTLYALKFEQSDIKKYGRPISFSLILFINLFIIFIFLSLFTDNAIQGCIIFWNTICEDSLKIYHYISELVAKI